MSPFTSSSPVSVPFREFINICMCEFYFPLFLFLSPFSLVKTTHFIKFPSRLSVRFSLFFLLKHFWDSCLEQGMVCLVVCILLSSVIKAGPWFHVRKWGREAGHTSSLHSFEVARSLDQCRQRYASDSALCLRGFHELLTIPLSSPPVECLLCAVCHCFGDHATGQPGITYLKGTWAPVRGGSEGWHFWYMLSSFDCSLSLVKLSSNSNFFHTSLPSLPHDFNLCSSFAVL